MSLRLSLGKQANANARLDLAFLVICLDSDMADEGNSYMFRLFDNSPVATTEWP